MARSRRPSDAPLLFDLPLDVPAGETAAPAAPSRTAEAAPPSAGLAPERPLFEDEWPLPPEAEAWAAEDGGVESAGDRWAAAEPPAEAVPDAAAAMRAPATLRRRLEAGLADLAAHVGAGLVGLVGAELLGARPDRDDLPALALYLLAFSFLYTVVPLSFWGHTPGMAWAGLVSRSAGDLPLSFGQTVRRWLAGLATVVALGLPALVALSGRSLADLASGSRTWRDDA